MEPDRTLTDRNTETDTDTVAPGDRARDGRRGRPDADARQTPLELRETTRAPRETPGEAARDSPRQGPGAAHAAASPHPLPFPKLPARGAEPRSAEPDAPVLRPVGAKRFWPRSFADRLTDPLPDVRALIRVAREGSMRPAPETLSDVGRLPCAPGPLPEPSAGSAAVTWVGHASWVVRVGGLTVLTDPVWSRRILGTPARVTPPGVAWSSLPPVDAVVVSHNHYDHLDAPTLRRLPRGTPLFVPAGLGRWCRRRGFTSVTELDWWEAAELPARDGGEGGRVRFEFVPAHHWSRRTLVDTCRSLWGGWVLTHRTPERTQTPSPASPPSPPSTSSPSSPSSGTAERPRRRVYFAGDTGYGHWFAEIGRRCPGIDLALLPVGAYEPRWMLKPVHTSPEEAVRACADVGARAMAPMHYGTFLLSAEPPLAPLERVRAAWAAAGRDRRDLWDLPVGASRVLEE